MLVAHWDDVHPFPHGDPTVADIPSEYLSRVRYCIQCIHVMYVYNIIIQMFV